jgi:hypothetical protein
MIAALILCMASLPAEYPSQLHYAVHQVETSGEDTPPQIGAAGERGPLQITRAAWSDTRLPGEEYSQVDGLEYSCVIFDRYMSRYATQRRLGRAVTDRDRCDIWNGGPRGPWATGKKRANLDRYWQRIKAELGKIQRPRNESEAEGLPTTG